MNVEWVLVENDEIHLESGLRYTSLCGRTFGKHDVERERFRLAEHAGDDDRCRACTLAAHEHAAERRRST